MNAAELDSALGPWNPGIQSQLPAGLLHLSTIYRPENTLTTVEQARERSAFTGLEPHELVVFRPERLALHELLIRVTGNVSIPDGNRYADLGINFRQATDRIRFGHIESQMPAIIEAFARLRSEIRTMAEAELDQTLFAPEEPPLQVSHKGGILGFLGLRDKTVPKPLPAEASEASEQRLLQGWRQEAAQSTDPARRRLCRTLAKLVTAIRIRQGPVRLDRSMLAGLATDLMANDHGSAAIGQMIEASVLEGAVQQGFRLLPAQHDPVIMNVKGASAAGKSTMRPLQRKLARRIGIDWSDFALISPDIWRKYLLDYDSLGPACRYAGTLTGHELQIVDQKLDRYMAEKARRRQIPHLLIDRFRFDSFAEQEGGEEGARLLTRFGSTIYMFFVITPPDATVERAWSRGLEFGRFKAVDDLLDHNVEAFTGMPRLFFTWASRRDKRVHYEFLDNGVPKGQPPRTVAFGGNDEMTVLDVRRMLDVDRYKAIRIDATCPAEVYPSEERMRPENNTGFLRQCAQKIKRLDFADHATGRIYASMERGRLTWSDPQALAEAMRDDDTRAGLLALVPGIDPAAADPGEQRLVDLDDRSQTLGCWGAKGFEP